VEEYVETTYRLAEVLRTALVDEPCCAVGWCAADQASRSQQLDMARSG